MPNGTLEDRFEFLFYRKGIWSRVIGTSQGGSHPRVGSRCYHLNKLVLKRSDSENLFCVGRKILGHIMKDFLCLIKFGTPCTLFFPIKNQSLAFNGLGEHLNCSLATEKPSFR